MNGPLTIDSMACQSYDAILAQLQLSGTIRPGDLVFGNDIISRGRACLAVIQHQDENADQNAKARLHQLHVANSVVEIQIIPRQTLDGLLQKLETNVQRVPGLSLMLKASAALTGYAAPSHDDAASCRLTPIASSGALTNFLVETIAADRRSSIRRLGKKKGHGVSVRYLNDAEFRLLEVFASWSMIQGSDTITEALRRMNQVNASLQLTLIHLLFLQRIIEDVNGMRGIRMASAVLMSARGAFFQLAKAMASAAGCPIVDEPNLLDWAYKTGDDELQARFLAGFFPDPAQADRHLDWLHQTATTFSEQIKKNWLVRLGMSQILRFVKADTQHSEQPNISDDQYQSPRPVDSKERLQEVFGVYGVSPSEVLSTVPHLDADDAVHLVGSVADGFGHFRSDIDLIVLTRQLPQLEVDTVSLWEGHLECYCGVTPTGNPICAGFISEDLLKQLRDWGHGFHRHLHGPYEDVNSLLKSADAVREAKAHPWARLMHRATRGVLLRDAAIRAEWEEKLPFTLLTDLLTCSHLVDFFKNLNQYEDTLSMSTEAASIVRLRLAFEHLLYSFLAHHGQVLWTKRWLPEMMMRVDCEVNAIDVKAGLFPRPAGVKEYAEHVRQYSHLLLQRMQDKRPLPLLWEKLSAAYL